MTLCGGLVRTGKHGFNGPKSATVLLVPGVHDIRIDYVQVPAASPSTCGLRLQLMPQSAAGIIFLPLPTSVRTLIRALRAMRSSVYNAKLHAEVNVPVPVTVLLLLYDLSPGIVQRPLS